MSKVYFIGGSPCSGKSTVAEILAKTYNLHYVKIDDYLDSYIKQGAQLNKEICVKQTKMSPEENWMSEPEVQCKEELQFYEETFAFALRDLKDMNSDRDIITEGAAFLPKLMKQENISDSMYLSITPTREFQISHYRQREWIRYVLEGCSDFEKAFSNWMERDCLFAQEVRNQCAEYGYRSIVNDGQMGIDEYVQITASHFYLN